MRERAYDGSSGTNVHLKWTITSHRTRESLNHHHIFNAMT